MKKVGIITSYSSFQDNYGAVLQGYALSKQIELLGYKSIIMPYIPSTQMPLIWKNQYTNKAKTLYVKCRRFARIFLDVFFPGKLVKKHRKFTMFERKFLPVLKKELITFDELSSVSKDYFAFICGSDQVWNPRLTQGKNDRGYFLDFVQDGIKRVAYAPSIGNSKIADSAKKDLKYLLEKFDALSIREKSGRDIIRDVCDIDVRVVLDPTMLLPPDKWNDLLVDVNGVPEKYIFVYRFGKIEHTLSQIMSIANHLGLPVIEVPMNKMQLEDGFKHICDVGPCEFISLIKNAALVLTDSFHATVFSIIQHTPFITFCREYNTGNNMNSRMIELLELVGLQERLVLPEQNVNLDKLFEISFDNADSIISARRKTDLEYLIRALK